MRSSPGRYWRVVFGAAVWVALIVVVVNEWDRVSGDLLRAGFLFPVSVVLIATGLVAAARGWSILQPVEMMRKSMVGFLAAQPAKYLPVGGAFQAVGQVGLSSSKETGRSGAGWAFLIHAGIQVVAAGVVSLLLVADPDVASWVRLAVLVLVTLEVWAVRESVVRWMLKRIASLIPRLQQSTLTVTTRQLWRSLGWTTIPVVLSGFAFAALLGAADSVTEVMRTIGAFSLAWVIGYLVFPLPSGLGAREAVLVALLPAYPSAQVLGVSLIHRFSTFIAELILLFAVSRSAFTRSEGGDTT
jgi:glycosyltransferase 2 family protein